MSIESNIKSDRKVFLLVLAFLIIPAAAKAQSWTNSQFFPFSVPDAIAVDGDANIIVTGGAGEIGALVLKYSSAGTLSWTTTNRQGARPNDGIDRDWGVAIDRLGNIITVGTMTTPASSDLVTTKYSPTGAMTWRKSYKGAVGFKVALDSQGNVVVAGVQGSTFVTQKYSSGGQLLWTRTFSGRNVELWYSDSAPLGLAVDVEDNVVVCGNSAFDTADSTGRDFVVLKYSSAGATIWTGRYDGSRGDPDSDDFATAVVVDREGGVIVTGFTRTGNWRREPITVKYTKEGSLLWVVNAGSDGLAVGPRGEVYVTGKIGDGLGDYTGGTAKYSAAGDLLWQSEFGESARQASIPYDGTPRPYLICLGRDGTLFVSGVYKEAGNPAIANFNCLTTAYSSEGEILWSEAYDGPQHQAYDLGSALTSDTLGNAYLLISSYSGPWEANVVVVKYSGTGPAQAPVFGFNRSGTELVLSWDSPVFSLQSASDPSGPFTTVNGAKSPYTNVISVGHRFFRLSR